MQIVRGWLEQTDRQGRFVATLLVLFCFVVRRMFGSIPPHVNWNAVVASVKRRGVNSVDDALLPIAAVNMWLQEMMQPIFEMSIVLVVALVIAIVWWPGMRPLVLRSSLEHA